jgi:DNA-binding MurR/RpiR family transcriptional regulator
MEARMRTRQSEELFGKLQERAATLPRKQGILARAIFETPELIAFGSVRDLASQLDMNSATIIRFAKSLGFTGYQELQGAVRETYLSRAGMINVPAAPAASGVDPVSEAFTQHAMNLESARRNLSPAIVERFADLVLAARRVVVISTGSAVVPATLLVRLLRHVGLRGEVASGSGVDQSITLHDLGKDDLAIAVGLWLTFEDTFRALSTARNRNARTVAIVGSATSPLTKVADLTIYAPAQGASLTFSVVATLAVVEALISAVAARDLATRQRIEQELHALYLAGDLLAPAFPPDQK